MSRMQTAVSALRECCPKEKSLRSLFQLKWWFCVSR